MSEERRREGFIEDAFLNELNQAINYNFSEEGGSSKSSAEVSSNWFVASSDSSVRGSSN